MPFNELSQQPQRYPTEVYDALVATGLSPEKAYISALLVGMRGEVNKILAIAEETESNSGGSPVSPSQTDSKP